MDRFIHDMMERVGFPAEARATFEECDGRVRQNAELSAFLAESGEKLFAQGSGLDADAVMSKGKEAGESPYTVLMLFYLQNTPRLHGLYKERGISDEVFYDSMTDLRCKLFECRDYMGVWGNFTGDWSVGFFTMDRFALGRLQFEYYTYGGPLHSAGGVTVNPGDKIYNMHIPSSGPFPRESRYDSYKKAYDFYNCAENGGYFISYCSTWLLYPEFMGTVFPEGSNLFDFYRDFDILEFGESEKSAPSWRVFGGGARLPLEQLPRDTSLRARMADWHIAGKATGWGKGLVIFDGEKLLTGRKG